MKNLKLYFFLIFFIFGFQNQLFSKGVPESFADLSEKLMPSVVNISTTQTVVTNSNPFPFQFPQDLHLKTCLKNLVLLKKENLQH